MMLRALEIQRATQGQWLGLTQERLEHMQISAIQTDSRQFSPGSAFLALRGSHFDGHGFAEQLADKACAMIGDAQGMKAWAHLHVPQLKVNDTTHALGDIAHAWRMKLHRTRVIAITGSYGKTTIRSMLAHTFAALGLNTAATHANLNNLIGVPKTLLGIDENSDIALIECGISEVGEMQRLSEIVEPDIAVITGISCAHAEGLGGISGVASEKYRMLEHLRPQGWCTLGKGVRQYMPDNMRHSYIESFVSWQLQGTNLHLQHQSESASLSLPLPAPHWGENMALVASIVIQFFQEQQCSVSLTDITNILTDWQPVQGRLQRLSGINGCTILDDSYNANPASMQAALHTLAAMPGRRIAIIGDMAELGADAKAAHQQLRVSDTDMLILVGTHMYALHRQQPDSQWFADTTALLAWLEQQRKNFTDQDHILIKASNSMQLCQVVRLLAEQGNQHVI